jgi:5,10-methylenetetrahydrofolate reductase
VFLGAAINPFAPPYDFRPIRLSAKKIAAGAQFVQSQYCFDVPMFRVHEEGARLGSAREVLHPGRRRPDGLGQDRALDPLQRARHPYPRFDHRRLEGAQDQKKEGKQLCIDIINEVKEIEGVAGIHVMAYRQEEFVATRSSTPPAC